jgi:hypothetical protein
MKGCLHFLPLLTDPCQRLLPVYVESCVCALRFYAKLGDIDACMR